MKREQAETDHVFRTARKDEAASVLGLYRSSIGTPFCVWGDDYPGLLEIEKDLASDNLLVLERHGEIIGAVSVVADNELDDLDCWHQRENAGEFARVVIRPEDRGRGLSRMLVANVIGVMKERDFASVHISVATQNIPAMKTYLGLGFVNVGQAEMWNRRFYLYELELQRGGK